MNYEYLKKWRNSLGITQEKAAELLGVHRVTYANWELGAKLIPKAIILACENLNPKISGSSGYGKSLIKAIDEYKEAYKVYFNELPKGKHLIPTPWKSIKYKLINFNPDTL